MSAHCDFIFNFTRLYVILSLNHTHCHNNRDQKTCFKRKLKGRVDNEGSCLGLPAKSSARLRNNEDLLPLWRRQQKSRWEGGDTPDFRGQSIRKKPHFPSGWFLFHFWFSFESSFTITVGFSLYVWLYNFDHRMKRFFTDNQHVLFNLGTLVLS